MTKKTALCILGGTALFAAGWFVRDLRGISESPRESHPSIPALAEPALTGPSAPAGSAPASHAVRAFIPGRPFPKGQARDWILGLTPGLTGDRRGTAIAQVRHMQLFFTMDEESVREAMTATRELIDEARAKNPTRRINHNGDAVLDSLLQMSLMRLAHLNPGEAMAALKQNPDLNDGMAKLLVMGTLAASDPAGAEQLALSIMEKDKQRDALKLLTYGLMSQSPAAALAFMDRHPGLVDDHERKDVFESWVRFDPLPAMEAAVQATVKSGNPEMVRNTIEEWAKVDPAAAAQWAASYNGPGSIVAKAMVLERRAREEPQAVLQEYAALQEAGGDPKELTRLTSALAGSLAGKDLHAARAWAETLPAGDLRERALQQVAKEWVKNDAPAASEWIRALPDGALRDGAARELTSAISRRDPAGAFEWARSIGNAGLRENALRNVMENWREMDPDAAKQAMESLPAEMRPKP